MSESQRFWVTHSVVTSILFMPARLVALASLFLIFPAGSPASAGGASGTPADPPTGHDAEARTAANSPESADHQLIEQLLGQIQTLNERVAELESRSPEKSSDGASGTGTPAAPTDANIASAAPTFAAPARALQPPMVMSPVPTPAKPNPDPDSQGGHDMTIPGGPVLKFRGFFDFNFGLGSIANPLVFPIIDDGCGPCGNPPTPPHSSFQAGEFDLFLTSRLSDNLSFLAETVLGPNATNLFSPDIERYQLTYKTNDYFSASVGRFHTSIGYYNTAYHHGLWFSTAEGRPIMYLFEDSGGILPVHMVGMSFAGAVPKTE
jgi:hypothetical protein